MKSLDKIRNEYATVKPILGFDPNDVEQGDEEWHKMRLGVITASCADKVLAKKESQTRATYMMELIAEVCSGVSPEVSAKQLEWGKEYELAARSCYEMKHDVKVVPISFLYKDTTMRVGCSPDGILSDRGVESKCPFTTKYHIDYLLNGKIKGEYEKQIQFSMWVTGAQMWDFNSYDPRMKFRPFHGETIARDEKMMARFDECVPQFIEDMDKKLAELGIEFGYQWRKSVEAGEAETTHQPEVTA